MVPLRLLDGAAEGTTLDGGHYAQELLWRSQARLDSDGAVPNDALSFGHPLLH